MSRVFLLLPGWNRCLGSINVARGVLSQWCARGDALITQSAGFEVALRELIQWHGKSLPSAALSRQVDFSDATGSVWLHADPAHVRADMATARMLACGDVGLSLGECAEIEKDLKPLFGDAGFEFDARLPNRWYLRAPIGSELPQSASPDEAIGDDLKLHLPQGASGKRWRQLFNESQIILHNHPVNQRRAARGAVSVNSLWFWGAGVLPDWARSSTIKHISSDRIEIVGLAALAKIPVRPLTAEPIDRMLLERKVGDVLIDLSELRGDPLESCLGAVDRALWQRHVDAVELIFASGERFRYRPLHRFRFWRRVAELAR